MLPDEVIRFFQHQHLTIVTTIDKRGLPHNSCKGIVDIDKKGNVYLLDLYRAGTYANLLRNPSISVTGVNEHKFTGYSLKGKGRILKQKRLSLRIIKAWEKRIAGRITKRLLREIRGEKGHNHRTEALLPKPQYLIMMKVKDVVDLTPHHIRKEEVKNETERQ